MLEEFVQFVHGIFPSIPDYSFNRVREALRQHGEVEPSRFYEPSVLPSLSQGDIIEPLRVLMTNEDGRIAEYVGPAILLSNTCDAEHDDEMIFCPGLRAEDFLRAFSPTGEADLRRNMIFNLLVLPQVPDLGDLVFNLGRCSSLDRRYVRGLIERGESRRVASLSQLGYYLFISKLTVHFLRPETGFARSTLQAS